MTPSRRDFLRTLLATGFCTGSGTALAGMTGEATGLAQAGNGIGPIFSNLESARAVGLAYLSTCPADATPIARDRRVGSIQLDACGSDPSALRAAVTAQVRDDYESGRLVQVDGWILSQTEARLCAFVALSCP